MQNYTLGLALFDYPPVIAAGFGLYLICRYCGILGRYDGNLLLLIPAIALTGGLLKATWKLIYALSNHNIAWLSEQLFFFLAVAYLLLATLVIRTTRSARNGVPLKQDWWHVPGVLAILVIAAALYLKASSAASGWSILLLATLSIANLLFLLTLISHSIMRNNRIAAAAFFGNLVLSYALVGLARVQQTAELQWIEQGINLASNIFLATGAWLLLRDVQSQPTTANNTKVVQ